MIKSFLRCSLFFCLAVSVMAGLSWASLSNNSESTRLGEMNRAQMKFDGVQVFTFGTGITGFFSQKTGEVYLYDGNLSKCVAARKLDKLGETLEEIPHEKEND